MITHPYPTAICDQARRQCHSQLLPATCCPTPCPRGCTLQPASANTTPLTGHTAAGRNSMKIATTRQVKLGKRQAWLNQPASSLARKSRTIGAHNHHHQYNQHTHTHTPAHTPAHTQPASRTSTNTPTQDAVQRRISPTADHSTPSTLHSSAAAARHQGGHTQGTASLARTVPAALLQLHSYATAKNTARTTKSYGMKTMPG
jgi:hypothetical protein